MQKEVLQLWIPDDNNNKNTENDNTCTRTTRPIHLIDGTLGLAGHTTAAIRATPPERSKISVLGIDRDGQTLARAKKRLVVAAAAAAAAAVLSSVLPSPSPSAAGVSGSDAVVGAGPTNVAALSSSAAAAAAGVVVVAAPDSAADDNCGFLSINNISTVRST